MTAATAAAATAKAVTAAAACSAAVAKLRVVSYNVLSSHLADPSHYTTLNPVHLEAAGRLSKILRKLECEIMSSSSSNDKRATIFCLQEVSYDWAGTLHTFFARHEYHVIAGLYGRSFNGYMGVLLAYPVAALETVQVDICRLSDTSERPWPVPFQRESSSSRSSIIKIISDLPRRVRTLATSLLSAPLQLMLGISPSQPEQQPQQQECHWSMAQRRHNVLLTAVLRDRTSQQSFCVANYHMPCCYYAPRVMVLHADLCLARVQNIAASAHATAASASAATDGGNGDGTSTTSSSAVVVVGDAVETTTSTPATSTSSSSSSMIPYILAGDFNIKPGDAAYVLLTTGAMDPTDPAFPAPPATDNNNNNNTGAVTDDDNNDNDWKQPWTPSLKEPVMSAYAAASDSGTTEPDFTNYSRVKEDEPFIDTLDYIFVSRSGIAVESVRTLPHRNDEALNGPFPNHDEPSDHVLIAANLNVCSDSGGGGGGL